MSIDLPDATVLYHADCADGFTAAWCAWRALGYKADYVPVQYGDALPNVEQGGTVYLLDFCFREPGDLEALREQAAHLTVLDHHTSARQALCHLVGWPGGARSGVEAFEYHTDDLDVVYDVKRSGAMLAHHHFRLGKDPYPLVQYVQDRDLWRWELDDSRKINAAIGARCRTFSQWDLLAGEVAAVSRDATTPVPLLTEGRGVLRHVERQVERLCENAEHITTEWGQPVPFVCASTLYRSEIGERLLKAVPEAPFSAVLIHCENGDCKWRLSSAEGRADVAEVAEAHGGGGHRHAAGFAVPAAFYHDAYDDHAARRAWLEYLRTQNDEVTADE